MLCALGAALAAQAQPSAAALFKSRFDAESSNSTAIDATSWARYTSQGLELRSADGSFTARVNGRVQLRFTSPFASAPRTPEHFTRADEADVRVRRARFKMSGQAGASWIRYKYEHDLVDGRLLDLRFDVGPEWLRLRAGQWKVNYSRERMDSSGDQQLIDRSIVNRWFTLDRQKGAMAVGRIAKSSLVDSQYAAGVFTGHGRNLDPAFPTPSAAADGSPLWVLRYQWNPVGGGVAISQSDIERDPTPRLSLAVAAAGNRSRFTRFSSGGGGQLDGFEIGAPGRYGVRQQLAEVAFKYRGVSIQQEWHAKRILDTETGVRTPMRGGYIQAGLFPHEWRRGIPEQLELAGRFAFVDPNTTRSSNLLRELTFGANWFFDGHSNKLTVDLSRYHRASAVGARHAAVGVRAQWDVQF